MGVLFGLLWAVMALAVKFFLLASEGIPDTAAGQLMADSAFWYPAGVKMGIAALIVMASTAFVYLLHSLAGSRTGGILLVFVCSVAMVYLSGGIVPSVFLPETMQKLGERMLMYGKEASNRKQEIDRQHYTIPNQRPKDKHCGKI